MAAEFQNMELDPKETFCFGFCPLKPKGGGGGDRGWCRIAKSSVTKGWKNVDVARIDEDLATNVEASYGYLAQTVVNDLDSGMRYRVAFDNDTNLWRMGISDSPLAEIQPEQAAGFFGSDYMRKFANRCAQFVGRACSCYREVIEPHMLGGELMKVSPVKLERLIFLGENRHIMVDNFRGCKYRLS